MNISTEYLNVSQREYLKIVATALAVFITTNTSMQY
jgi:hypothetical protein